MRYSQTKICKDELCVLTDEVLQVGGLYLMVSSVNDVGVPSDSADDLLRKSPAGCSDVVGSFEIRRIIFDTFRRRGRFRSQFYDFRFGMFTIALFVQDFFCNQFGGVNSRNSFRADNY